MNETSINQRIGEIVKYYNLNKTTFSERIGMTNNVTIGRLITNDSFKPSYEVVKKILDSFGEINPAWLVTGAGDMILKHEVSEPMVGYGECQECKKKNQRIIELQEQLIDCLKLHQ